MTKTRVQARIKQLGTFTNSADRDCVEFIDNSGNTTVLSEEESLHEDFLLMCCDDSGNYSNELFEGSLSELHGYIGSLDVSYRVHTICLIYR